MRNLSLLVISLVLLAAGPAVADIAPPPDTSCQGKKVGDNCYNDQGNPAYYGTCEQAAGGLSCKKLVPQPDGGVKPGDTDEGGCSVSSELPTTSLAALLIGLWLVIRLRRKPRK